MFPGLRQALLTFLVLAVFAIILIVPKVKFSAEYAVFFISDPLIRLFSSEIEYSASKLPSEPEKITSKPNTGAIIAEVLKIPPTVAFGSIIVSAGRIQGVSKNMEVVTDENVFVGFVDEVFEKYSRIRLLSYFGQTEQVRVGEIGAVTLEGLGGMLAKVELPRDMNLTIGELVILPGAKLYLAGFVESIDSTDAQPILRALVTLPFNVYELKNVYIIP
ncbi:MAG: rod shape-determining protein MreC [Patescibacteria group bacterium]